MEGFDKILIDGGVFLSLLEEILDHNRNFVDNHEYEIFQTTKFPDKKLVILSCMDTRLVELLPHARRLRLLIKPTASLSKLDVSIKVLKPAKSIKEFQILN